MSAPATPAPPPALVWPDAQAVAALREVVVLGFYRGIIHQLDQIEARDPACAGFVAQMRALARQFQFETMDRQLERGPSVTE